MLRVWGLGSAGCDVIAEPGGQGRFIQIAASQGEDRGDDFLFGSFDTEAVQTEEQVHGLKCDALVSIDERVVACDAKAVSCSEGWKVCVRLVAEPIAGALQGRLKQSAVTKPNSASVGSDLIRMDGKDVEEREPARLVHLASSRMALR